MKNLSKFISLLYLPKIQSTIFVLFLGFAVVFSAFVYMMFSDVDLYRHHPRLIVSALYFDIVCVLTVMFLGIRQLTKLYMRRKGNSSRLTLKLISIFSLLSIIPSAIMCVFSALFFHNGLDSWFNERNQVVLRESINISSSYLDIYKKHAMKDCALISKSIEYYFEKNNSFLDDNNNEINRVLDTICKVRDVNAAIIIDSNLHIIAHTKYSTSLYFFNFYYTDVFNLKKERQHVKILTTNQKNAIYAVSHFVCKSGDMILLIEKKVDANIFNYVNNAQSAYGDYQKMHSERSFIEISFLLIFLLVGILLLILSIAIAVVYSWKIVRPVSNLVDVAEKITKGNLSARAQESKTYDEIRLLSHTFNHMVETMQSQQKDLIQVNKELDEKAKFATSVLSGVSSGVIGIDNNHIYTWNEAAEKLLGRKLVFGENIENVIPSITELLNDNTNTVVEKEIQYKRGNNILMFSLKLACISLKNEHRAVVTFTDLTDILLAQRKAAWSEVARRVAHEIKNPLTPIQLSAERIKRKYLKQISEESDTFVNLTDVIVKQVGDIKRLLDEFNFFARLPEPKLVSCNFFDICSQAVFLMQNVADDVIIHFDNVDKVCKINADERLLHQSIVNLIQNAINALGTVQRDGKAIWISLYKNDNRVILQVDDNGPGLPKEKMESLATPYFTLMPKGTGLGLAIVKKIIQDHQGELLFGESAHGGAKVILSLPKEVENG